MSKDVVIIGAGPAGIFTALTLAEANDSELNITLTYSGGLPWERGSSGWEGFMGGAFGNDIVLAGEPDMAGDICSYIPYAEAIALFDKTIDVLKSKTISSELIETVANPYTHHTLPADTYRQIANQLWADLRNGKVNLVNEQILGLYVGDKIQIQSSQNAMECDYCVLAGGKISYSMLHSQAEERKVPRKELQINEDKFNFFKQHIPEEYQSWGYGINLQVEPTMELANLPNTYLVGDILGNNCIMTAMVQGTIAAQSILNKIK
jgi:thioredoxin reductase